LPSDAIGLVRAPTDMNTANEMAWLPS